MANGATAPARILEMPHLAERPKKTEQQSWFVRKFYDVVGTTTMSEPKGNTPEFHINYATITVLVVLLSAVIGGWVFMWRTADAVGYERGKAEVERQQLMERLDKAEKDAATAKQISSYQAGAEDAHKAKK